MMRSRKGGLHEIMFIGVAAFAIALCLLLCYALASIMTSKIYENIDVPAAGKADADAIVDLYPTYLDGGFVFLISILSIATIILAALVRVHPIFIPMYVLGLIAVIFTCGLFSNAYDQISAVPILAPYAADLSSTHYLISKLPLFVGIIGTILCIFMYKLWSVQK